MVGILAGARLLNNFRLEDAAKNSPVIASGVNCYLGKLTNRNVALAHGYEYAELAELI